MNVREATENLLRVVRCERVLVQVRGRLRHHVAVVVRLTPGLFFFFPHFGRTSSAQFKLPYKNPNIWSQWIL